MVIDDPVIQALMRILDRNDNYFKGSATTLLELMHTTGITGLPKAANSLSAKITRLTSDLAKESITITRTKDSEGNRRIEIVRPTAV